MVRNLWLLLAREVGAFYTHQCLLCQRDTGLGVSLCLGSRSRLQRDVLLDPCGAARVTYAICALLRVLLCPAELLGMLKGWNKCPFFFFLI